MVLYSSFFHNAKYTRSCVQRLYWRMILFQLLFKKDLFEYAFLEFSEKVLFLLPIFTSPVLCANCEMKYIPVSSYALALRRNRRAFFVPE